PVLEVQGLNVRFATPDGEVRAASDIGLTVRAGDTLGVVGESGSGKTQVFLAVMGLLAANGRAAGSVKFRGQEILGLPAAALNRVRGGKITMIFQDPMTSLNPYLRISRQMTEVLVVHKGMSEAAARAAGIAMLDRVRIPDARQRFDFYPHEFSGGMRQRAMIAMALLCEPDLLIADEPTTALDVTVQAQILALLAEIRRDLGTAIVLITHDFGVIADLADRVMVMYGGRIAEEASVFEIFDDPRHPYTRCLLDSMPRGEGAVLDTLPAIAGQPPNLQRLPPGCAFAPRCTMAADECRQAPPPLAAVDTSRRAACFRVGS
ncbi:MAG: ATP-binding cassette domain-containing protein, partial [Alphaproteobacteria bacterium]|nr:ATP-binding cassette domain-containing protein [Alphaproteobacteria bacterium]